MNKILSFFKSFLNPPYVKTQFFLIKTKNPYHKDAFDIHEFTVSINNNCFSATKSWLSYAFCLFSRYQSQENNWQTWHRVYSSRKADVMYRVLKVSHKTYYKRNSCISFYQILVTVSEFQCHPLTFWKELFLNFLQHFTI